MLRAKLLELTAKQTSTTLHSEHCKEDRDMNGFVEPSALKRMREQIQSIVGTAIPKESFEQIAKLQSLISAPRLPTPVPRFPSSVRKIEEILEISAQEEEERRAREEAGVRALEGILHELQEQGRTVERLATRVEEHEVELRSLRTGASGRPGSRHFVEAEFGRRDSEGLVEPKLADEARYLAGWLRREHPEAHPITPHSVENVIRVEHRQVRQRLAQSTQNKR